MMTNIYKLVYGAHATQYRPVANGDMTGHLGVIAHNAIVTHNTIMCQMAIRHQQAILSDYCFFLVLCTPVNGYIFPDRSVIANNNNGIFTLEFHILRNSCKYRPRENATVLSDTGALHDRHIRSDPCAFSDFYILVNDRKWINLYIRSQPGIRMNISMRMNHAGLLQKSHVIKRDVQK